MRRNNLIKHINDIKNFYPKIKYQIQYYDYDENIWTVPLELNETREHYLVNDNSIKTVKLIYNGITEIIEII